MARVAGASRHELILVDNLDDGKEKALYYRMPTTEERSGYINRAVRREGDLVVTDKTAARIESGLEILTGIRDGEWERVEGEGEQARKVAVSSNPGSPDYYEGWQEVVEEVGGDMLELLGLYVFDMASSLRRDKPAALSAPPALPVKDAPAPDDAPGNLPETSMP